MTVKRVRELRPGDVFQDGTKVLSVQRGIYNFWTLTLERVREGRVTVDRLGYDKIILA